MNKTEQQQTKEISYQEWKEEGIRLFGKDSKDWKFKCPNCGNVQHYHDFEKLGIKEIENVVYFSCIGRWTSNCEGEIGNKKSPCNYTNGGLFNLAKIKVDFEGNKISVFEFAEQELDE